METAEGDVATATSDLTQFMADNIVAVETPTPPPPPLVRSDPTESGATGGVWATGTAAASCLLASLYLLVTLL